VQELTAQIYLNIIKAIEIVAKTLVEQPFSKGAEQMLKK
jgi:hypothetical protein